MSQMTFEGALKRMPGCLYAGLDLVGQHKNVSDLVCMAETELSLADEGDIELTARDRMAIRRFREMLKTEFGV